MKKILYFLCLVFMGAGTAANSQEIDIDVLLKKYVGEIRYKKVISDHALESSEGTERQILVEVGGYHSGQCKESGPCGCAEKTELYLFSIIVGSDKQENVNSQTLGNDCNDGPRLVIKEKDGNILIGEEIFVTKYIFNKGEVQGAFTDVQLAQ